MSRHHKAVLKLGREIDRLQRRLLKLYDRYWELYAKARQ